MLRALVFEYVPFMQVYMFSVNYIISFFFLPKVQPPAKDVCLHGLTLFGSETKLRHQLGRVLQGVTVAQLAWTSTHSKNWSGTDIKA